MSVFTMEIKRPGNFGLNASAELTMPATWSEYKDAIEKARLDDSKPISSDEILNCKYDWLRPQSPKTPPICPIGRRIVQIDLPFSVLFYVNTPFEQGSN